MHNKFMKPLIVFCITIFTVTVFLNACSKTGNNNANSGTGSGTASGISIKGFAFSVSSLTVKTGTTVTWTNNDAVTHTVTADAGSFNSGNMAPGSSFSTKFTTAGTYAYHCNIHPSMTATVVVQ